MKPDPQAATPQPLPRTGSIVTSASMMGLLAVVIFAGTVPMTRLANGSTTHPQLPPEFVALGRAALAGLCATAHLMLAKARLPSVRQLPLLAAVVVGGVLVFPLGMGWAVRRVPAAHAATLIGALPLCTAALAAVWLGQQPGHGFWWASLAGALLVSGYAALAAPGEAAGWGAADAALAAAMAGASLAYVAGARLSRELPAAQVISWALVLALPLTLPAAAWLWPRQPAAWSAWAALAYVALASSWLGFFAWYAALARDPLRVSQIQLLQPFASLALSALLLDEVIEGHTLAVAAAVLLLVMAAQRRPRMEPQV